MIDEEVHNYTGLIYAQRSETTSPTIPEFEDEKQLEDPGSSDIPHQLTREVSPSHQGEPYRDALPRSHNFGLNPPPSPYALYSSRLSPRLNIPYFLLNPIAPDSLQTTVLESWADAEPSQANKDYLAQFLEDLSVIINSTLGGYGVETSKGRRRFELDVFGSVSWGGLTGRSGDLDLVLIVSLFIHQETRLIRCHRTAHRLVVVRDQRGYGVQLTSRCKIFPRSGVSLPTQIPLS